MIFLSDLWFVCFDDNYVQLCPPIHIKSLAHDFDTVTVNLTNDQSELYSSKGWVNFRNGIWDLKNGKLVISAWDKNGDNVFQDWYQAEVKSVTGKKAKDGKSIAEIKSVQFLYNLRVREVSNQKAVEAISNLRAVADEICNQKE